MKLTKPFFLLACVASSLLTQPTLHADLEPLKYNNPGLKVDLGVGLWAWPMPMDYDGDGDMDLLVACPDSPTNGVYFFENPSQDPKVKMPVFKPGIRLGPASHNMQVSYVNGKPRILKPGYEFPRDAKSGKFDFENPKKIYQKTNVHKNGARGNMWRYVDYDGDGDQDLVIGVGDWSDYGWDHAYDAQGRWRNGPLHGYVYWLKNEGSNMEPKYADEPTRINAGDGDIDVYGWPSPNFTDWDGDGDLDLICGEFLDGFTYFENIGDRKKPIYASGQKMESSDGKRLTMDLQMITPTAFDWDGDGDLDLIVGDEDGRVALIENRGNKTSPPNFSQPVYFQQQADTLKFGALATPFVYDWDSDGDDDILCGNTAGYIGFFENLGETVKGLPKWAAPRLLEVDGKPFRIMAGPNGSIQGPCEAKWGYTTLSVADWDFDKNPDLFVNGIWGRLHRFTLEKSSATSQSINPQTLKLAPQNNPDWFWWNKSQKTATTQWRTTPLAIDWNNDKSLDMVALDREGFLSLFEQKGSPQHIFLDEDLQPIRLNLKSAGSSGRYKLAVVDWDGDGRKDILVNSENATWYRNCKDSPNGKVILKKIGNLAKRNVAGHTSSPAICDFDKDGKPDLLVGAENGRIYHIKHDDCIDYPAEKLKARDPKPAAKPKFPGFVSEDFVFTKAKFPQCHASSICKTSRGLVATWFGGKKEGAQDVGIWVSYHDGANWSAPKEVANGIQYQGKQYPCWNPVLYQPAGDAPTLLFFKVGPSPSKWWGEMMVSYDRGRTWRERRRLPEGIDGPVRCKPVMLADGKTLLCGSSTEYDGWTVHFELTKDLGKTWQRIGPINKKDEFTAIQPTILQHQDGKLQVLCRSKRSGITTSRSDDQGKTWSPMEKTGLPNPNAGVDVVNLADGRFLMIYNHLGSGKTGWGRRGLLNLAISKDGKEWRKVAVLEQEEKAEFSYPAIIQTKDGQVHISYTWKRQRIKHVVIDPSQIKASDILSMDNWHGE
ncbi:MAG: exo-alpha-sialidase [Verrucomicrobiota bacterium]